MKYHITGEISPWLSIRYFGLKIVAFQENALAIRMLTFFFKKWKP